MPNITQLQPILSSAGRPRQGNFAPTLGGPLLRLTSSNLHRMTQRVRDLRISTFRYDRQYSSNDETRLRFRNFVRNMKFIKKAQKGRDNVVFGITRFTDWSEAEMKSVSNKSVSFTDGWLLLLNCLEKRCCENFGGI